MVELGSRPARGVKPVEHGPTGPPDATALRACAIRPYPGVPGWSGLWSLPSDITNRTRFAQLTARAEGVASMMALARLYAARYCWATTSQLTTSRTYRAALSLSAARKDASHIR